MNNDASHSPDSCDTLSIEDARGEELFGEEADGGQQVVVAADGEGNSLTLLEELAQRRARPSTGEIAFNFVCAAASLAFALLIHLKTQ